MNKHLPKSIKVVLFDHDDTLVGTIGTKWAQHKFVAQKYYGKELTDDEIILHWGKPLLELVGQLYGTDDVEQALANNIAHHTEFEKELFKATIPTLKHLKKAGLLLGIITATARFSLDHDLKLHKIPTELLDYTQTAEATDFHKPDPRVFEPALEWLKTKGIKPEEVLYIGDGLHDMKAATGAGFNFLGVQTGLVTADEFTAVKANSIRSLEELLQSDDYVAKTIEAYDHAPDKFVSATSDMLSTIEMNTMLKYLPSKDATILDIGCGSGKDMQYFADQGYRVKGIDLSAGLLKKAQELHPELDFQQMDVRQLDFADESFGAVWCSAVLLHLNEEDLKTALAEIRRVLVPGGVLAVSFKEGEGSREVVETFSTDLARFYTFKTVKTLNRLLEQAGFTLKENIKLNERERFGPDKRDLDWVWAFAVKPH